MIQVPVHGLKSVLLGNFRRYMAMFPDDKEIAWMATEGNKVRLLKN